MQNGDWVGAVVGERYELQRALGQGQLTSVWLAQDRATAQQVAVKVLHASLAEDETTKQAFLEAAARAERWGHSARHIVKVLAHGALSMERGSQTSEIIALVMEHPPGETLAQRMAKQSRMSLMQMRPLVRHIARALQVIHSEDEVHGRLTPHNVFLMRVDGPLGSEDEVKLLDCGFSQMAAAVSSKQEPDGQAAAFLSPEQARGESVRDQRSDLWSTAAIVYAAVVGEPPFGHGGFGEITARILWKSVSPPSEKLKRKHPGFDAWVGRGLAREPRARFQSAEALAQSFEAVVVDEAKSESRIRLPFVRGANDHLNTLPSGWRSRGLSRGEPAPTRRGPWLLLAGAALAIFGGAVLVAWLAGRVAHQHVNAPVELPLSSPSGPRALPAEPTALPSP